MTEHRQGNRSRRHFGTGRNALLDERHGQPAAGKDTAAKSTTTPNEDVQMSAAGRPSAFLEGSMHDRASAVPPTRFTADEALLERYIQDGQPPEGVQAAPLMKALPDPPRGASTDEPKHPDASAKVDKDGQRRSGIFRFGKSIASAFSTASIKKKHDGEGSRGAKAYSVEEHRHRVEKIYAEMKKDGRLPAPTVTTRVRRTEAGASVTQHKDPAVRPVDQTEKALPRESREQACQDQTVKNNDDDDDDDDDDKGLPRQPASEDQPIASPGAESTASHRNPFHFRRPSVPNLKKVKSGIHRITSESLVSLGTVPPVPPVPAVPGDDTDSAEPDRTLRTQKSRKDLHRQQKLSKRVSNLEGKLLSARRELDEAMGQAQRPALRPLPANTLTMRAFVGGTLPSLPSERFLLADKLDEHDKGRGSFDEKVFRVDAAAADMESAMTTTTTTTTTTATSPLRIMSVGEGVDRSPTRESNTTPGKRKSGGNHMERYQTDEARDQSPAHHPLSSPSKKRRVEAAPRLPADDDELAQNNHNVEQNNNMEQKNNIERSLPRSESISSTLALTNEVALFESALEPRPAVIQSIAEESMAVDTPSSPSPHSSSTLLFPQSAPLTGPAMGLFPPRHATDPSLSSSTRRKGSKIPRRSISPPPPLPHLPHSHPPSLPPPHPCSAVTRQLRSRASMPRLESSSSSFNSSTNFRSEAESLVPPLQPTKKVLPRSPALHMAVGPPCERGREGVVVLGVASSLGWNRRGIDLAVSGDCSGYGNGSVNGSVKGYGYGNDTGDGNSYAHAHGYANRNANGNETGNRTTNGTANGSTDETETGNATARGNAAGHEHGDTNTGDLHDRLVACAELDGGIDAVGVGSGATAGAGAGASAALGAAAGVGANASVGAGDDGFEWPDDVF